MLHSEVLTRGSSCCLSFCTARNTLFFAALGFNFMASLISSIDLPSICRMVKAMRSGGVSNCMACTTFARTSALNSSRSGPVHAPGMALHKDAKGLLVATQDLRHYGCVADFHLLRLDRNCREWLGLSLPLLKSLNAVRDPYDKQVIGRECTRMNTKIETNPGHFDRIHSLKIFAGVCIPRYASGLQKKADFQEEACSTACPTRSTLLSSKCLPNTCRPIGRPVLVCPQGTLIPGIPARSAVTVKMSARYMANGSSAFSPSLNAGVGAVGVTMASTFRKASSKSRVTNVRTRWALR